MSKKLFIIGLPRSGTTLLYKALHSHSQVSLFCEVNIFEIWPESISGIKLSTWAEKTENFNGQLGRQGFTKNNLESFPSLKKNEAIDYLYEQLREAETEYVGEKSVGYCGKLEEIHLKYPEAKFIIIWRDLLDILDSAYRGGASGEAIFTEKDFKHRCIIWMERLLKDVHILRTKGADMLEINFHNLVSERKTTCLTICNFLNIPYDDKMMSFKGFDNSIIVEGNHHKGVKENKIDGVELRGKGLSGKWEDRIRRFEKRWSLLYGNEKIPVKTADNQPSLTEILEIKVVYFLTTIKIRMIYMAFWVLPESVISGMRKTSLADLIQLKSIRSK